MLRKILIAVSAVAALGLAISTADAQTVHKKEHVNKNVTVHRNVTVNKNVNVHRNVSVNRNVSHGNFVIGRTYNGHVWYGHNRHRWHGRWYAYGVGPCWINVEGNWFWNVLACP
jgi:hypothetical protein